MKKIEYKHYLKYFEQIFQKYGMYVLYTHNKYNTNLVQLKISFHEKRMDENERRVEGKGILKFEKQTQHNILLDSILIATLTATQNKF